MLCFCEGECSEIVMAMPSQERQELLTDYLAESFGERAKHPFAFLQFHWAAQPFSGGAYSSYFPTGVWTQQGRALREPRPRARLLLL